jgi:hypothetical protein
MWATLREERPMTIHADLWTRIEGLLEQDPANLLWIKEAIEDRAGQAEGRMAAFTDAELALLQACLQHPDHLDPAALCDEVTAELERRASFAGHRGLEERT